MKTHVRSIYIYDTSNVCLDYIVTQYVLYMYLNSNQIVRNSYRRNLAEYNTSP